MREEKGKKLYVIQKHDFPHLHYDLRLEINDVLKSWAVPKTPPEKKGIKRLAVQTADHSVEYGNFEGVIPDEGSVEIWDKGTFEIEKNEEDKLVVFISGRRLVGRYCLVRFKGEEKNWLLFKC